MRDLRLIGGACAILLIVICAHAGFASDSAIYFSSDANGKLPVEMIQEGDEVWICVLDSDEDVDCDTRDKISPEVKVIDPKTGAFIVWNRRSATQTQPITAFDCLEETGASTGLFVSRRPFQIGTREDYGGAETQAHVVDSSAPNPQDFMYGCFLYNANGIRGGITYAWPLFTPAFGDLLFVPMEDIPVAGMRDMDELPAFLPFPAERLSGGYILGRIENMDTLVGLYQDDDDPGDVSVTMAKLVDVQGSIGWDQEVYKDGRTAATITVLDADENLNCSKAEWVPVFIIVNPGSWTGRSPTSPANFCALKATGGVDENGSTRDDPIRWYNIYHNGQAWSDFPEGTYLMQYDPDLFSTLRPDGLCRVMFYAQETGTNTGIFELHLNDLQGELGFAGLQPRDLLAAYYLDPNDFDDFEFALAYIEDKCVSRTAFVDADQEDKESYSIGHDPVHVQVIDPAADVDPCCPERVRVHICDPHWEDDSELLILDESFSSSSIFFNHDGMPLAPVWDAGGMGYLMSPGGFQLVIDNWRLEVFNEDSVYVRYNREFAEPERARPTGEGRLVVLADDWPLGEYFDRAGSDSGAFLLNCLAWLTEEISGSNNRILIDKGYEGHSGGPGSLDDLVGFLANNGYYSDVVLSSEWTSELLRDYAVAILERGPAGYADALTRYLRAGYGVIVIGGEAADARQNEFLVQFNVQFEPHEGGLGDRTLDTFVPHPITEGVDTLYTMNPTPIAVLGPGPLVLCQQHGDPPSIIWLVALDLADL